MGISINTNLSSLIVQQNLTKSTLGLNKAIERMTTGYKINGAKDNAAGCSISEKMSRQLSSFDVASDNVAAGMDLVTTASDTIDLMINSAQRLHALSTQARNGTYGKDSINAMNQEASAIVANIMQLYNRAEYNNIKLFDKQAFDIPDGMPKAGASGFIAEIDYDTPDVIVTDPTQLASAIASKSKIGIGNAETLAKLAELVNSGTTCSGKTIVLTEDIDLSSYDNWTAIGNSSKPFNGTFNGNGHKISNLKINKPTERCQGLFGYARGEIKNLGIENCDVNGNNSVGGLAGSANEITNSYATGTVSGQIQVGGLAGSANEITNSYATGSVTGKGEYVGGLAGYGYNITNSYATGIVSGTTQVGGLVGQGSNITNSYATGIVSGNSSVGGLAGRANETITNSYATGKVSGVDVVGQFVGNGSRCTVGANCFVADYGLPKFGTAPAGGEDAVSSIIPKPTETTLQVGIYGESNSQITFNTNFSYDLSAVLNGIETDAAFDAINTFLKTLNEKSTDLGAISNRLDSALESIETNIQNLTSSRSTIKDADVATESSNYIKMQILQQASATLLSTANQTPALALTLLNGIR